MAAATEVVRATLNFAVDASDGGVFSNDEPEKSRQTLASFEIAIHNARELSPQASVWHEGFMLASHPISNPDFHSEQWLRDVYLPSCLELVKRISGARNGCVVDEARVRSRRTTGRQNRKCIYTRLLCTSRYPAASMFRYCTDDRRCEGHQLQASCNLQRLEANQPSASTICR